MGGRVVRPVDREYVEHVLVPENTNCIVCSKGLWITQWRERGVTRLDGLLHILTMKDKRCGDKSCPGRQVIFRAPEELRFAVKNDSLGIDVLVKVGELRFRENLTLDAIRLRLLDENGIKVCEKTVSNALIRFLALSSCTAGESEEARRGFRAQGGIVALVDGVQFDGHTAVLYVASDAISGKTLFAERHEVRSGRALQAIFERIKALDVPVLGLVTDKEKGLVPAVKAVFPDVPHQFCQLHFLKNCAKPLDETLTKLGAEVTAAAEKLRKIRRRIKSAKPAKTEAENVERELAEELLLAAHAASKVSGRAPFKPPALKRHERLLAVSKAAVAATKKGGLGRFSKRSQTR